jgi:hypothetical protein
MLSSEALRLTAVEALCPTAAAMSGEGFPTLAKARVFDSRAAALEDLDRDAPEGYTPVLSLYTPEAGFSLRGPAAAVDDTIADAALDIVAELAVAANDDDGTFVDAIAATDPQARIVLAALCSQVRYVLEYSESGSLWRHIVRDVKYEEQTFAVPELGLRWQRVRMRFHCGIRDDDFSAPGLPEPLATVFARLPAQSYAKATLSALVAHFQQVPPPALERLTIAADGDIPGAVVDLT